MFYARIKVASADGRMVDRRVRLKATTLGEARLEHSALRGQPLAITAPEPEVPSQPVESGQPCPRVEDFIPIYLERARLSKRPATVATEKIHLGHWRQGELGRVRLVDLTKAQLLGFRDRWLKKGWSRRTANLSLTVLRNLLRCARDEGVLDHDPTAGIRPLRHVPRRRPLFTTDQVEHLATVALRACPRSGPLLADFLHISAFSGVRYGEALRLRWDDVRWDLRKLVVGADGLTKNHETRYVDFNPRLEAVLKDMRERVPVSGGFLFGLAGRPEVPMKTLREVLNRARRAAGLPSFGFHDCRHHFISYAVMSGIDFMTIARWVGHKDGGILIGKVYGHLSGEHLRAAAARLSFGQQT